MVNTRCAVYRCTSTTHRNRELRFHQFPRDERLQVWLRSCKRPELEKRGVEQLKYMHICSLHFEKRMYGKQLLKKSAIPTLNLPAITTNCVSTQTDEYRPDDLQILTSEGVQTDFNMDTFSLFRLSEDIRLSELAEPRKIVKEWNGITQEQFLGLCDVFLPSALGLLVRMQLLLPNPNDEET